MEGVSLLEILIWVTLSVQILLLAISRGKISQGVKFAQIMLTMNEAYCINNE
jgi:hypothetical protein